MRKITIIITAITMILVCCDKINNSFPETDNTDSKIASKLNITDADYLVLKSNVNNKSTQSTSNLYKLIIDGEKISEKRVNFLNELGNEIDSIFSKITVNQIRELKEGLICLQGSFEIILDSNDLETQIYSSLLVRTSDGAIFDFNGHFPYDNSFYLNQNKVQTDKYGNIYYDAGNVYKLSETENGFIQEEYLPAGEEYFSFFIDLDGNCYYYTFPYTKVKKCEGGIVTSDIYREFYCIWNTYDDNIMASVYDSIGMLNITDNKLEFTTFASLNSPEAWTYININHESKITQIFTPDINSTWKQAGSIIFEETKEVYDLLLEDEIFTTNKLDIIQVSDNYLFLSDPYSLSMNFYKINLSEYEKISDESYLLNSYVTIDFPDDLEVKDYEIIDNGEITFYALRLSDEMHVTGVVDSENTIKILSESSDKEFCNLIRLN